MEGQIGLEMCTKGTAERETVKGKCLVEEGTLMIVSPVFPMIEMGRSDDYGSIVVTDSADNLMPLMSQLLKGVEKVPDITPYMKLTPEQAAFFCRCYDRIVEKQRLLDGDGLTTIRRGALESMQGLIRREMILEFAYLFLPSDTTGKTSSSRALQVVATFLLTLNREYKTHRTVNHYAERQGLTPRHFADIVKRQTGFSPMEWINMYTISQAKQMLHIPGIQVKDVADSLGFPEQFTFRKYFKTHTGMSPTEFRKGGR